MNRGYLGLQARYSQAWLASPFIVIVIFVVRLILLRSFIYVVLSLARKFAIMECSVMQKLAQGAVEAPQDMIKLANKLISASINEVIHSTMKAFASTVTLVEALILFALEMTVGTYACLALSAVDIGANEALNATEFVMIQANRTIKEAAKDINAGLSKLTKLINGAIGLFDSVDDFITGGDSEVQKINLTIAKLNDFSIPPEFNEKLESLRHKIPTYNGTMHKVESLIKTPLNEIKSMIKASSKSIQLTFIPNTAWSKSAGHLPQCNITRLNGVFDNLEEAVSRLTIILCALCILALLGGVALNLYLARSKYQRLLLAAETVTQPNNPFVNNPEKGNTEAIRENMAIMTYHLESSWLERCCQKLVPSQYWWALQYSLSLPLVGFLMIGVAGIILGLMELIVVDVLNKGVETLMDLETAAVGDLGNIISRAYAEWQNQTNSEISHLESSINDQYLGWIHHGSKNINSSLASLLDGINKETNSTFHGTPLLKPLQAATACLIGNKITKIEKGLTWMYDNSEVSLPRVNDSLLSNIKYSSTVAAGEHQAYMVVNSAVSSIRREINTQFIVSGTFVAVWLAFTIAAIIYKRMSQANNVTIKIPRKTIPKFSGWKAPESMIRRRRRPKPLKKVHVSSPLRVKSPIEQITERVTQYFSGPAHRVAMDSSMTPKRASVLSPESPKTPLRAMIFRNH